MATAWSPLRSVRDRGSAAPFRLRWLMVPLLLLFGVMIAHGASAESAESTAGHLAVTASSSPQASTAGEAGDLHPAHAHAPELCVSGQPQRGAELPLPCVAPAAGAPVRMPSPARYGVLDGAPSLPPPRSAPTGPVVQQV